MPTTIDPKLPEWADPATESVFDPLHEVLLKRAAGLVGGNDPSGLVGQVTPTPLIAKVPFKDIPWRNARLRHQLELMGAPEELHKAVEYASQKYPRILGHVNRVASVPEKYLGNRTLGEASFNAGQPFSRISVDPASVAKYRGEKPGEIAKVFGHELTHAAQNLWDKDAMQYAYPAFSEYAGYFNNAMETGANKAGANFKNKFLQALPSLSEPPPQALEQVSTGSMKESGVIQKLLDMFNLSK